MTDTENRLLEDNIVLGTYVILFQDTAQTLGRIDIVDSTARAFFVRTLEWDDLGIPEGPFPFDVNTNIDYQRKVGYPICVQLCSREEAISYLQHLKTTNQKDIERLEAQIHELKARMANRTTRATAFGL